GIQRQVHEQSACLAGRLLRHSAIAFASDLPEFLSSRRPLGFHRSEIMQRSIQLTSRLKPLYDLHPREGLDREQVLAGLRASSKTIAPKYFYDARGSWLFDRICELPEYYIPGIEATLLQTHAEEISEKIGDSPLLIEYGSGSSYKTRILLDNLF